MRYDNERDRNAHGYDAGAIVDGTVVYDEDRKEYVLVDEDGTAFSSQEVLKTLLGKQVRLTCVSFEAIESLEKLVALQDTPQN